MQLSSPEDTQAGQSLILAAPSGTAVVRSHRWGRIAAISVLGLFLLAWMLRDVVLGEPVMTYAVHRGNLTQSLVASGRVVTPERVAVASPVMARVVRVAVDEGGEVVRGQLLIELDSRDAFAAQTSAEAIVALTLAQSNAVSEVELPAAARILEQSRAALLQVSEQFDRLVDLQVRGFVGKADLDKARRDRDVAQSQALAAELQVTAREAGGSHRAMALASLAQARAALDQASAKLAQYRILAPASGVLMSRAVESGDVAQPGQLLMLLASTGTVRIEVQLDEKNLGKLALGQAALASADAYPEQRFAAMVTYINPGIDATRGSVMVRLDVLTPPAYLRQDMTVSVDIATAERRDVLVIPAGAVHDLQGEAPWVLAVRERLAVRQLIDLGLLGDDNVEVRSGLKDGEQVIAASAVTVQAGARVRGQPEQLSP
jgi:HlyD family secretion protein